MAKSPRFPQPIKGKLYRNSECEICGDYLSKIQVKMVSATSEKILVCRSCFSDKDNGLEDFPK